MKITTRQLNMIIQFFQNSNDPKAKEAIKYYNDFLKEMLEQKKSEIEINISDLGDVGKNFAMVLGQLENKQNLINETIRSSRAR